MLRLGPHLLEGEQHEQLRSELLVEGDYVIEVRVREQVIEGYDESYSPVLRREPLGQAGNKKPETLVPDVLFGPILVGASKGA